MQQSQIPVKISTPFADSAVDPTYKHQVPIASQIGITPGAASFTDGFPPVTFLDVGAGGVPPFGNDFNGLLFQMSSWLRWMMSGGAVPYDAAFQTLIGGYPLGAIVASATTVRKFWVSTTENNVTDPDAAGAGWQATYVGDSGATAGTYRRGPNITVDAAGRVTAIANATTPTMQTFLSGSGTYTTPANCTRIKVTAVAAGGGSGASSTGGTGGTTSFNSVTAIGGGPNGTIATQVPSIGGIGGTGGTGGTLITRVPGQQGAKGCGGSQSGSPVGALYMSGGQGGSSILGFGAMSDTAAVANTGAGAGGISSNNGTAGPSAANGGGGGGEGYTMWIYGPAATYAYAVGAAGAAGTSGFAGGSGKIIVEEFYD